MALNCVSLGVSPGPLPLGCSWPCFYLVVLQLHLHFRPQQLKTPNLQQILHTQEDAPCLPSLHPSPFPPLAPAIKPSCGSQVVMLLLGDVAAAGTLSKPFNSPQALNMRHSQPHKGPLPCGVGYVFCWVLEVDRGVCLGLRQRQSHPVVKA